MITQLTAIRTFHYIICQFLSRKKCFRMTSADAGQSGKKDGSLDEVWEKEVGTAKTTTEAEWTKAEVSREYKSLKGVLITWGTVFKTEGSVPLNQSGNHME